MAQIIQLRRGTSSEWSIANTVLADGELGLESDTRLLKSGNGVTPWQTLPYLTGSTSDMILTAYTVNIPLDKSQGRMLGTTDHVLAANETVAIAAGAVANGYAKVVIQYSGGYTYNTSAIPDLNPASPFVPVTSAGSRVAWEFVAVTATDYFKFGIQLSGTTGIPGAPTTVTLGSASSSGMTATFVAPVSNGGSAIDDYRAQYSTNGGTTWTAFADAVSTTLSIAITGLAVSTSYIVQISAHNSVGWGPWSASSSALSTSAGGGSEPGALPAQVTSAAGWNLVFDGTPTATFSSGVFTSPPGNQSRATATFSGNFDFVVEILTAGEDVGSSTVIDVRDSGSPVMGARYLAEYDLIQGYYPSGAANVSGATVSASVRMRVKRISGVLHMWLSADGGASWTESATLANTNALTVGFLTLGYASPCTYKVYLA